jgi:O-antigen ligase
METALLVVLRWGVLLLLLMPVVVTPSTIFPFVVGKALYSRCLIEVLLALWLVLVLIRPQYRPRRSLVLWAFCLYVAVSLLSGLLGVSFQRSLWSNYERMQGILDLAHWLALATVLGSVFRGPDQWRSLVNWELGVSVAVGILGLAQHYGVSVLTYVQPSERLEITIGNAGYVGIYALMNFMLALGLLAYSFGAHPLPTGRKFRELRRQMAYQHHWLVCWRIFWALVAILNLWILSLSGTRGALAGLVAGLLMVTIGYALWGGRRELRRATLGAAIVVLAGAISLFLVSNTAIVKSRLPNDALLQRVSGERLSEAISQRLDIVRPGIKGFLDRPLLGWGPENYTVIYDRFVLARDMPYPTVIFDHAHHKLVEELSTRGVVGLMSYLLIWGAAFWVLVRSIRRRDQDQWLFLFIGGALGAYFIANLFWFDSPATMLMFILPLGWVISLEANHLESAPWALSTIVAPRTRVATSSANPPSLRRVPWATGTEPPKSGEKTPSRTFAALSGAPAHRRGRNLPGSEFFSLLRRTIPYALAAILLTAMLGLGLYNNYRTFRGAEAAASIARPQRSLDGLVSNLTKSSSTFSPLGTFPRLLALRQIRGIWNALSKEEKTRAMAFAEDEGQRAIQSEPHSQRLYVELASIYQLAAPLNPFYLKRAGEYTAKARQLAPHHSEVQYLLATQKLVEGDAKGALQIIDNYVRLNPRTCPLFQRLQEAALRQLLEEKDPRSEWGVLRVVLTPRGHYLWLCYSHAQE